MKKYTTIVACLLSLIVSFAQTPDTHIRINQLGYYTFAPKIAIIVSEAATNNFYVVSAERKDTVFKGQLSAVMQSSNSSLKTRVADFSALDIGGVYVVAVPGLPDSYTFRIGSNANYNVAVASLKGFYFIRASMPLDETYAGKWARQAGHPDNIVLFTHPLLPANGLREQRLQHRVAGMMRVIITST